MFLRGSWMPVNLQMVIYGSANGLSSGGSGPSPKLLAEAQVDDNERRLRDQDLARSGPMALPINIQWGG